MMFSPNFVQPGIFFISVYLIPASVDVSFQSVRWDSWRESRGTRFHESANSGWCSRDSATRLTSDHYATSSTEMPPLKHLGPSYTLSILWIYFGETFVLAREVIMFYLDSLALLCPLQVTWPITTFLNWDSVTRLTLDRYAASST